MFDGMLVGIPVKVEESTSPKLMLNATYTEGTHLAAFI
jgi:hypothetical protein